eukprot:1507224-Rhodomonas_salina.2
MGHNGTVLCYAMCSTDCTECCCAVLMVRCRGVLTEGMLLPGGARKQGEGRGGRADGGGRRRRRGGRGEGEEGGGGAGGGGRGGEEGG